MIEFILRVFLLLHGLWLCRIGMLWIKNPRIEVFEYILTNKGLDGPGLDIMVPFLGKSFFTAGILDLVSSLLFGTKESSYVLIISGIFFHFGAIFIRSTMDEKTLGFFKEGYWIMNSMQFVIGFVCLLVGILGYLQGVPYGYGGFLRAIVYSFFM